MKSLFPVLLMSVLLNSSAFAFSRGEPIFGESVSANGIQVQFQSGGCTGRGSFHVLRRNIDGVIHLTFERVLPDLCLADFPYGISVLYPFDELGLARGDSFVVTNPMQPIEVR